MSNDLPDKNTILDAAKFLHKLAFEYASSRYDISLTKIHESYALLVKVICRAALTEAQSMEPVRAAINNCAPCAEALKPYIIDGGTK